MNKFTYIDLFSGIGGLRVGFQKLGGECVFSCEKDKFARKTYKEWFKETPFTDIRYIKPEDVPEHDILLGGFPCQSFSIVGMGSRKFYGKPGGFRDAKSGNLFFYLLSIVKAKRPKAIVLENVKNLKFHDNGNTRLTIVMKLLKERYWVFEEILNAKDFGVPQSRNRIFFVCFNKDIFPKKPNFSFPKASNATVKLFDILEKEVDDSYTLSDRYWSWLLSRDSKYKANNGFAYKVLSSNNDIFTITGDPKTFVYQTNKNPRKLTIKEVARLMGFNQEIANILGFQKELPIVVSYTQAYKQFGNAVVPQVSIALAEQVLKVCMPS